jgi:hypothetical protein
MGRRGSCIEVGWESQTETTSRKMYDVDGRIILRWILEKQDGVVRTGIIWLMTGTTRGLL